MKEISKNKYKKLLENYFFYFINLKELNLVLPKNYLQRIINNDKYVSLFYYISQIMIFYKMSSCKDNNVNNFCYKFDYIEILCKQLLKDKLERYEIISILVNLKSLFYLLKSCEKLINIKFHYIKITEVNKNSIIDLSINFLNKFIDNLNEESPSFFNLVEINSGYFKNKKMFIFDMIALSDLKAHLKETIPSIICFYSCIDTNNKAFESTKRGGVFLNEQKKI